MRSLVVLGLTGWAMLGCSREEAAPPAPAEAPAAPAKSAELAAQARATAEAKTPSMSIEAYEALMLALGDCALKVNGIDRECPAWRAFDAAREARAEQSRSATQRA